MISNFIKGKFGIKTERAKGTVVKEKFVKIIEAKDNVVKEGKTEAIKKFSNKRNSMEQEADEVLLKGKEEKDSNQKRLSDCESS